MSPPKTSPVPSTGVEARLAARTNIWNTPTCGIAPGHLQANLIVLPSKFAQHFQLLCTRNPVPCPLLASSASPGDFTTLTSHIPGINSSQIAQNLDIRTDAPRYNVYYNDSLIEEGVADMKSHWKSDHVAFLIGCSYSFESALTKAGLTPPHILHNRNVSMYRTTLPLCPAGIFTGGTYVVSMRMYKASEIERVRDINRPYTATHGEPIAWGWDGARKLGIGDVGVPDWGDAPPSGEGVVVREGMGGREVPVF